MRILHTSDWHLGRSFHGASLLDEQAEALDRIVALVEEHRVELVVVAGDLYDRAVPPAPAVDLFERTLPRLRAAGARIAAISGNHDSAVRIGVRDQLLGAAGVAVRGDVARIAEPLVLERPADGGPPVAVYLVPFLEPSVDAAVLAELAGPAEAVAPRRPGEPAPVVALTRRASHDHALRLAAGAARRHLATLGPARSVLVAHAFVAGGTPSDSERELSVGGADRVALSSLDGFDLVALGHLHRPQDVAGPRIAYSGSPLPYSFSEEGRTPSVRLVELAADGSVTAEHVPLGVGRPLRTLTGRLDELLADPALASAEPARVRAVLTDDHLPVQAMARLRRRFPHAVELRHEPPVPAGRPGTVAADLREIEAAAPIDLALRFWADQQGRPASPAERAVLERAVAAAGPEGLP